jgi:hypothetical protein
MYVIIIYYSHIIAFAIEYINVWWLKKGIIERPMHKMNIHWTEIK